MFIEVAAKGTVFYAQILFCPASIPDTLHVPGTISPSYHRESFLYSLYFKEQVTFHPGVCGAGASVIWVMFTAISSIYQCS